MDTISIRPDLSKTEIIFLNGDTKCNDCNHLEMFHDAEDGMCLVDDCSASECGRGK